MHERDGIYIALISIHGLIRAQDPELGRDPDTGGQILYVLELARALARHPGVVSVDLLTRQVIDPGVSRDYAREIEPLAEKARIIRLPCGPRRYLRKESLWPHLDGYIDAALQFLRREGRLPHLLHSHYADAGLVGSRLSQLLGVPLFHTGHSLGRVKRQRLLDQGQKPESIESRYNLSRRIEAEEITLGNATGIITSTNQEVEEQYSQYENYHPNRMIVIPPGVDVSRFQPPGKKDQKPAIADDLARFLRHPDKPPILALSRPDERKNIASLVHAFGQHPALRDQANLIVVAGNRDDISTMDKGSQQVLQELLYLIDRYDLYGSVAYPKHHQPDDVPLLYRWAATRRGLFVNPALTEPFGLTLIEAAASGLPIVATNDGGPRDIIRHCENGQLIDPLDIDAMGATIADALANRKQWEKWSRDGIRGVRRHFTWDGHVASYLELTRKHTGRGKRKRKWPQKSRMVTVDRLLVCDIDNTLLGDAAGLHELLERLRTAELKVGLGIATGRRLESAIRILRQWKVPVPDVLITAVGSEIHYGNGLITDHAWEKHINHRWHPEKLRAELDGVPGLRLQPKSEQLRFKLSYFVDPKRCPPMPEIRKLMRQRDLRARLIYSHGAYLDFLPLRASKGLAVRYLALRWGMDTGSILVAGDSGNDEEMLTGNTLGAVVGNYSEELEKLRGRDRIYFAGQQYAQGIVEAMDHYNFLGKIRVPGEVSEA